MNKKLILIIVAVFAIGIAGVFSVKQFNYNALQSSNVKFNAAKKYDEKVKYYKVQKNINVVPANKAVKANNIVNMKYFFNNFYSSNLNANTIDLKNYNKDNGEVKEVQDVKSAYENLENLQFIIKRDGSQTIGSSKSDKLLKQIDKLNKDYSTFLNK